MITKSKFDPVDAWQPHQPNATQPWTIRLAAHLLRRAGFGGTQAQLIQAEQTGLAATIERLFDVNSAQAYNQEMEISGRLVTTSAEANGLAAWWLLRMAKTPCPLQEKMTLFWHGHFATGADKVNDSRAMLRQNDLLRKHCLSQFQPMVTALSRDVAMLIYLDSTENRKTRPNENCARELMELFCLGPGNYSETDIKEIARCFTGWEVRRNQFVFNSYQHDSGQKSFLSVHGNFDGDQAIEAILQQPAAARFMAKKLIRFFVFDDEPISDELAEPIAVALRDSAFDIALAMKRILSSKIFFSDLSVGKKIKSPVELAIGALRFFDVSVNLPQLGNRLQRLGQVPLYPPNVKGWDGGRSWINASTILARANLFHEIFNNKSNTYAAGSLAQWVASQPSDPHYSANWINDFLLAEPLSTAATAELQQQFRRSPALAISCLAALPQFQLN